MIANWLEEPSDVCCTRTSTPPPRRGHRRRPAQGVLDRGRGQPGLGRGGRDPGGGQPGRLYRELRRFAASWPDARWAIEGAAGLGAPLAERLREDQIAVTDVPAKLARRVRLLSTGHGRKSDPADALSVGIAAWSAPALRSVEVDEAIAALRAVTEHRDDLVRARTQLSTDCTCCWSS
ncbi:MAG: transposase [Pseudonocardiales bacterium]